MTYINLLGTTIFIIMGYLIGSISPAILISRKRFITDIREHYSHNAGAANAIRVMGRKWGITVLMIDGFKPIITVLIAYCFTLININNSGYHNIFKGAYIYASGFATIVGHCWPIYFQFKGGKGAASALGFLLIINPLYFLIAFISWWILLYFWRMSSLSSILMTGFAFIIAFIPNIPFNAYVWPHDQNYYFINILIALTWIVIIIRHYDNLKRIHAGTERTVQLFDRLDAKLKFKPITAKRKN